MTMNPVIKFEDYKKIGTMETALSKHADEAFFELSAERQKVAEKIFKCLTETDRENRVIRRATTVEKLCAVADADLRDVVAVIEVFRKEGRTFLMPPPEVSLNANSLIDISHESLIRKWEKLTKWVEEEGQSAQTYRRLAEDALLHKQGKVGFWSEPELSDALEWREDFKPNETWAQLYGEKGEKQSKASFAESMQYLDDSKADRDAEVAEEERQQEALRKYAVKLHRLVFVLGIVLVLSLAAAGFAFVQRNAAVKAQSDLNDSLEDLKVEKADKEKAFDEVKSSEAKLSDSLDKQKEATENAEEAKKRAEHSEAETEKALEMQTQLAAEAKAAKDDAIKKKDEAEKAQRKAEAMSAREKLNRAGLTYLEKGEFTWAKINFDDLLLAYDKDRSINDNDLIDGRWWTSHNLGIVNLKLGNFEIARDHYTNALKILSAAPRGEPAKLRDIQINRGIVATYRRLAQLHREQAKNITVEEESKRFMYQAIEAYKELIEIIESLGEQQSVYSAEVYIELADCYSDILYEANPDSSGEAFYDLASKYYGKAEKIYESEYEKAKETSEKDTSEKDASQKNTSETDKILIKQVTLLKKWADSAISYQEGIKAVELLEKAIDIQENKLRLGVADSDIGDSYDKLAKAAPFAVEGDQYDFPPYDKVSQLIRDANFAIKTNSPEVKGKFHELADTYLQIGKCSIVEEGIFFTIIDSYDSGEFTQAEIDGNDYSAYVLYLEFLVRLADFYQNVRHDNVKAKETFDKFSSKIKNTKSAVPTDISRKSFEKTRDFYVAANDSPQALYFYEYLKKEIKSELEWNENPDNITEADAKKSQKIEIILAEAENTVKIARISAEAEAMFPQIIKLVDSKLEGNGVVKAKVLTGQADFYEERGNKEKAKEFYLQAEAHLTKVGTFSKEIFELQIHIQKGLGNVYRHNAKIAADLYEKALSNLEEYENPASDLREVTTKNGEITKATPYIKNGKLTEEYWMDKIEILNAWTSLNGIEIDGALQVKLDMARATLESITARQCSGDKTE